MYIQSFDNANNAAVNYPVIISFYIYVNISEGSLPRNLIAGSKGRIFLRLLINFDKFWQVSPIENEPVFILTANVYQYIFC